jgi:hypothetical protein
LIQVDAEVIGKRKWYWVHMKVLVFWPARATEIERGHRNFIDPMGGESFKCDKLLRSSSIWGILVFQWVSVAQRFRTT